MKASIGVPAYNQGQYLGETLDSLLHQAVPPDEIVVSDNHSTDETPEILRRYEGRIRVIRPAEHMAVADHWNFVAGNLHSEWFSMLSSDDIAEPSYLENLLRYAARDSSAVLVRGGWSEIAPDGHRCGTHRLWSTATVTKPPQNFLEQLHGLKSTIASFMCRKSAFDETGGFTSGMSLFDVDLFLRLSPRGPFVTSHSLLARKREWRTEESIARRIVAYARDQRIIALDVIPRVAAQLSLPIQEGFRRAALFRLSGTIAQAQRVSDPVIRNAVADELRPLAQAVGGQDLLDQFEAGREIKVRGTFDVARRGTHAATVQLRSAAHQLARRM